jgi:hypothetical protein
VKKTMASRQRLMLAQSASFCVGERLSVAHGSMETCLYWLRSIGNTVSGCATRGFFTTSVTSLASLFAMGAGVLEKN